MTLRCSLFWTFCWQRQSSKLCLRSKKRLSSTISASLRSNTTSVSSNNTTSGNKKSRKKLHALNTRTRLCTLHVWSVNNKLRLCTNYSASTLQRIFWKTAELILWVILLRIVIGVTVSKINCPRYMVIIWSIMFKVKSSKTLMFKTSWTKLSKINLQEFLNLKIQSRELLSLLLRNVKRSEWLSQIIVDLSISYSNQMYLQLLVLLQENTLKCLMELWMNSSKKNMKSLMLILSVSVMRRLRARQMWTLWCMRRIHLQSLNCLPCRESLSPLQMIHSSRTR